MLRLAVDNLQTAFRPTAYGQACELLDRDMRKDFYYALYEHIIDRFPRHDRPQNVEEIAERLKDAVLYAALESRFEDLNGAVIAGPADRLAEEIHTLIHETQLLKGALEKTIFARLSLAIANTMIPAEAESRLYWDGIYPYADVQ